MKRIVFIFIILSSHCLLFGQIEEVLVKSDSTCNTIVKEAEKLFQDGLYDKCIEVLEGIPQDCKFLRSEKMHVMELLAKAYVETDDLGNAESTVNLMLRNFPHYELKEEENSEAFNRLVKKYKIHPLFSVGMRNTMDWVSFKTTKVYSLRDDFDYSVPYSNLRVGIFESFGLMYYAWGEIEFDRGISFDAELILKWTRFYRNFSNNTNLDLDFMETDNYLEIPVSIRKYFHIGNNTLPYITAGMGWLRMTKATGSATIYYADNDSTATTGSISMLDLRNKDTFEWTVGFGIGYKYKNLRLFVETRYLGGLNDFTNPDKGLTNDLLVNDYYYIDNSVRLRQFEIGFSVSYTLINSVKRQKP